VSVVANQQAIRSHVSKGPLERLEAENAQLRGSVLDLLLQIQALRDDAE
jgi:hypothetical protein